MKSKFTMWSGLRLYWFHFWSFHEGRKMDSMTLRSSTLGIHSSLKMYSDLFNMEEESFLASIALKRIFMKTWIFRLAYLKSTGAEPQKVYKRFEIKRTFNDKNKMWLYFYYLVFLRHELLVIWQTCVYL